MGGSFAVLAGVRRRELKTRLVVAALVAFASWFITPTWVPLAWFGLVVAIQSVDLLSYRRVSDPPTVRELATWIVSTFVASSVYSSLGAYLWFAGGETGRMMGLLLVGGSLLHVTIHMHHVRRLMLASITPHTAILLALPISGIVGGQPLMWPILLGAVLYLAHLVVAFRQAHSTTQLIQDERRRAEDASKAKSDFLATVSHEIRTPMNAIVSAANLLGRSRLSKAQREQVEMLKDANDVLLSLLNDVLDLSRIEAGKMTIEPSDFELRRTAEGLQRLWRPRAEDKGLELRLEIAADVPARVRLDPLRLKQILSNLISNAVKFTDTGSVTVRVRADRGRLAFEVSDTGVGIPAEAVERLFSAFEQAGAGAGRKHGGSGLGLAISRRLAAMMDGELSVESVPGEGSTFRLVLPLVEAETTVTLADDRAEIDAGLDLLDGLSVLVAEDHPVNRRVLELLLAPSGCQLTFCEDGAQAVEVAQVQAFDAILMDMQMPVMDGVEATRRIKAAAGPNARTPVIALTANALEHHRAEWATVDVQVFVSKPIEPQELFAALAQAGRSAAARRAA
ncbi:MAG: hybrid sensor histidine kinase/response regulator [Phenylobacterium zucineum]|nr:MAG: hybrid sensor histidine kinase/response regulator [Phenylobacterium zucineum]